MSEPVQKCENNFLAIFNKSILKQCSLVFKLPILVVLAKGEIQIFKISSKKVL